MKVLCLKNRWDEKLIFNMVDSNEAEVDNLIDTLKLANRYTIENDFPGFFFETADSDYAETNDIVAFVNDYNDIVAPCEYEVLDVINIKEV